MTVAIRPAANGVRAVFVISLSPSRTGARPINGEHKRIFFHVSAMCMLKKDFLSIMTEVRVLILPFLAP
jgi:hypothetical protein